MPSIQIVLNQDCPDGVELPLDIGAYAIQVKSEEADGAMANFMITGNQSSGGSVFRACATPGSDGEHLTIFWGQGVKPVLKYMQVPRREGRRYQMIKRYEDGEEEASGFTCEHEDIPEYEHAYTVSWMLP